VSLAGSEYLATILETVAGKPVAVDLTLEKLVQAVTRHGVTQGWLHSAHDCAEGGLAVALAESAIAGGYSAAIDLENTNQQHIIPLLFGEGPSRIVVSVDAAKVGDWEVYLQEQSVPWQKIGNVVAADQVFAITVANETVISIELEKLTQTYNQAIPRRMV
jgi:phosphoribosylformylglycinamidine synthase